MRSNTSVKQNINSYRAALSRMHDRSISLERTERYLIVSYHDDDYWAQYLTNYYDLFTDIEEATIIAKTYSLAITCKWLNEKKRCSFTNLYNIITRLEKSKQLQLWQKIMTTGSLPIFIRCIEELNASN